MAKENIIINKAFDFSLQIIELYKIHIQNKEFIISKQLLRSATSIGANIEEATGGITRKEFIYKLSLSLKEAKETKYWLMLLDKSKLVDYDYSVCLNNLEEILKILTSIIKTAQEKNIQNS